MKKEFTFQKLTPSTDINMDVYEQALEYVFSNNDVKNIAISGTYGAGKSSMIESYKKSNPDKKFIHISLAHFMEQNESGVNNESSRVMALEGKIINQLIHQIEPKKIPLTNFRIKKDIDRNAITKLAILVTVFIAITCFLCFKNTWENMIDKFSIEWLKTMLYFTTTTDIEFVLGAIALVIMGLAIYEIIILQQSMKMFKKLNVQGNEIEVFEESKDSYFDKYLNEVLYIFEHSGADGIIFEDIDRYNTNLIFEKLREINYLLNKRRSDISTDSSVKIIRFIYLLRDDIFDSKDRTKFFDFIIPIVPVVDASNAYDKFLEYFKKSNLLDLFDMDFLQDLSLYVDDMRVLKNICNEFVIYYERLKTSFTEKSNNKLLAMIAYKNLFPNDFGCLQMGTGYVYTLFDQKDKFKKNEINCLNAEIGKLEAENKRINAELCNDLDDLNAIYFTIKGRVRASGKEESEYKTRKDFVKALLNSNSISRYNTNYYSNGWEPINIDNEKRMMEENSEYIERKLRITQRSDNKVNKNKGKIDDFKLKMEKVEHAYLKNIITRENEDEIFSVNYINEINEEECFEEVKRSPYFKLIKYLIRNGYIDETYPDYMTYFYENSITAIDKTFLRSISDKIAKPYNYKLNNVPLVVSRMRVVDFKEEEALNINVLEELLTNPKRETQKLKNFMYSIWNVEPIDFVTQFLRESNKRKDFVREFNLYWTKACHWILTDDRFEVEEKRQYIATTLCVSSEETILEQDENEEIKQFIENDMEFLSINDLDLDKIEYGLELLDIKFESINFKSANDRLLKYVYENDMYYIDMEMTKNILLYFYNINDEKDFLNKNLSLIMSKQEQPLCQYVLENIDSYLKLLCSNTKEIDDTIDIVLYVLNSKEVSVENKKLYIERINTLIDYLFDVEDHQLWNYILKQGKTVKDIENVYDYYYLSENGMDDELINYINQFEEGLDFNKIDLDEQYGENAKVSLFYDIIKTNGIDNDKYKSIVCSFDDTCELLEETTLSPDKVDILINCNILEMNVENLMLVRDRYPSNVHSFIMRNISEYIELIDENVFISSELLYLLDKNIADDLKLKLLSFETQPLTIEGKNYTPAVEDYIVENLYNNEDIKYLVQWYPQNRIQMKNIILNKSIEEVEKLKEIKCIIHSELLFDLIKSNQIDDVDKEYILANQIKLGLDIEVVKSVFEHLHMIEYLDLLDGKRPKINATLSNENLLNALLERKWFSSYELDKEDEDYFQTYGKRKGVIIG